MPLCSGKQKSILPSLMHELPPWSESLLRKIRKKSLTWCLYFNHSNLNSCWLKSKNIHSKILPAPLLFLFFFFLQICALESKGSQHLCYWHCEPDALRCRGLSLPWRVCSSIPESLVLCIRCQQQPHHRWWWPGMPADISECPVKEAKSPLGWWFSRLS